MLHSTDDGLLQMYSCRHVVAPCTDESCTLSATRIGPFVPLSGKYGIVEHPGGDALPRPRRGEKRDATYDSKSHLPFSFADKAEHGR